MRGQLAALRTPAADLHGIVLPQLLNDLAALDRDLVLVIEDYHVVTNGDVHRALAFLVERAPSRVRVIISTRVDPPLPLGRLRARGELLEVRADDLRFSDDEARGLLASVLGVELADDDVARLQARTEGWPAALYLAALSLRGRPDVRVEIGRFAGDDRFVVDYLTPEVLGSQTPGTRAFLLRTSVLERFNAPLCDAVTGGDDAASRLAELERSNLLLVALDAHREWFRYHHLFGELLRRELDGTDRASVPGLHRRAAAWFREAGLVVEAGRHAIAGGDLGLVGELIGRHYGLFVDAGRVATVTGWLEVMPDRAVGADWLLAFAGAVVHAHAGNLDEAERWLGLAERAPQIVRNGQEPAPSLSALAAYLRLLRGDLSASVALARRALAAPAAADPGWALAPRMVLAPALWWTGAPGESRSVHEAIDATARAFGLAAARVYSLGNRAGIALDEQDAATAAGLVEEALRVMGENGLEDHPWSAMAHVTAGTLLARTGSPRAASDHVERGLALGERTRAWQLIACASLALAEVRQRQGDPVASRRLLTRVREILVALPDPGDGLLRLERTEQLLRIRAARHHTITAAPFWDLSPRELEVLRLLPSELSQREIAAELYVSFNTIRTHTRVIFSKLGVTSRGEAVARATELGLL